MYQKHNICIVCNIDSSFDFDLNKVNGGSETWIINIANQLSNLGYYVYIFNKNTHILLLDNIEIHPIDNFEHIIQYVKFDHILFNREFNISFINILIKNQVNSNLYYIAHDIGIWKNDKEDNNILNFNNFLSYKDIQDNTYVSKNLKGLFFMSDWHINHNISNLGYPSNLCHIIGNGINTDIIDNIENVERDNSLLWSSCYERGLDIFLKKIMPKLLKYDKNFKLYISSYNDYSLDINVESIINLGKLNKDELYTEMKKHKVWFFPLTHWETFCITAIENAACNVRLITPFKYGVRTPFKYFDNLFINDGDYEDDEYCDYVANTIIEEIEQYNNNKQILDIISKYVKNEYSWKNIGKKLYIILKTNEKNNSYNCT